MTSNPSYNKSTGGLEVAEAYSSRAAGKICLITGVTIGGIGYATACALAHGGASTIVITGRNEAKLTAATKDLSSKYPTTNFRPVYDVDMASLAAVKQKAEEILNDKSIPHIDILIANTGKHSWGPREETGDGIEEHFAVNHLAHFVLVTTLMPKVLAAAKKNAPGETRIVPISSGAIFWGPVRFSDWQYTGKPVPDEEKGNWSMVKLLRDYEDEKPYEHEIAYAQSKTANVLMAVQIDKLYAKEGIYSFAVHPGLVASTGLKTIYESDLSEKEKAFFGDKKPIDQGSAPGIVAALDPGLAPEKGVFIYDACQFEADKTAPWAVDEEKAERLWKLSEDIIREKLGA